MYQVLRIAVDELGQPISGVVERIEDDGSRSFSDPVEVGPFDSVSDVVVMLDALLDKQMTLW